MVERLIRLLLKLILIVILIELLLGWLACRWLTILLILTAVLGLSLLTRFLRWRFTQRPQW
ncbi:hypothetical protein [Corynebacterium cystitidis]|uniref:hypothetical protein n=1 Tax=Corynebacterium cystitidis TaxID=35757 RepID=UPI00211F411A|nr:hypothetical protein [Corynebacterium cystitidis]